MSLTDELKPCPFCGCHGVKYVAHEYLRHTIKCEDCPGQMECYSSSKEQAIAAWNRRAIEAEATKPYANADSGAYGKEYTGQGAPVATKPQGPVHWRAVLCAEQVPQHPTPTAHVVGFRKFSDAESWVASKLDFDGWRYTLEPLFTTPQPCLGCQDWAKRWNKVMDEVDESRKPCPSCAEKQSAIDVWEGRYADLSAKCAELEAEVEKWSTDFVRISDNYSEEAQMNMDFGAERLAFILKEQKQAERIAELESEHEKSEEAWETLDMERVQYLNDVGDVLGQNNTDESLIDAARRVMTTIEFQKKAWGAESICPAR